MKRLHYIFVLLFFSAVGFGAFGLSQKDSTMGGISISIASSGLFALFIETGYWLYDKLKFGYLEGEWKRTNFYNRNNQDSGSGYDDISDRYSRISGYVILSYKGEGEYLGSAVYEEGEVSFILNINKDNRLTGSGTYQYNQTRSQSITADIGLYTFVVDKDRRRIYILHQNVLPSGNAKGLEIWQH